MSSARRGPVVVTALLVLVILVAVNLLASRFFTRLDLTENREYTISSSTRRILTGLDDVVNVKVYFSRNLPPYLANLDRQVKDMLDEYVARGNGNLQVEYLDPEAEPQGERALQMLGIPKVQLNIIQKDKAEVTGVYLGIAVQHLDRSEVLPVVQGTANLEYDLTSAILKVTAEPRTVGVVAAGGELGFQSGLQQLRQLLQRQYAVREMTLAAPVPEEVTTLVVIDNGEFSPEELYHADQFLMRGGSLMVLTSGVDIPEGSLMARDRSVAFGDLLRDYGVDVGNALVADGQAAMASFSEGYMTFSVPYPWWPKVTREGLSQDSPVTAGLDALVFPWVSPLIPVRADTAGGAPETTVFARSSPRSFRKAAPYDLNPNSRLNAAPGDLQPQVLALALSGSFPSHWGEGRAVPGDSLGTAPAPLSPSALTRLLVVGNWRFATDRFLQQFPSNGIFLANAVDWMTLGTDLIAIRSRGAGGRPLREVEDAERNALKLAAILGVPVLVVVGGLVRARVRQARRRREAREYGGTA